MHDRNWGAEGNRLGPDKGPVPHGCPWNVVKMVVADENEAGVERGPSLTGDGLG